MWTDGAKQLADALARDLTGRREPAWPIDSAPPALRVIDCVLSLNRNYDRFVTPRVGAFRDRYPAVVACEQLRGQILAARTPAEFMEASLSVRDLQRAETLLGVAEYLIDAQQRFDGGNEVERLRAWARWARPGDFLSTGVGGFGLAGFQYLRMLFGADTVKPDVHIVRYVSGAVGRRVSDVQALYLLERAAELSGQSPRRLDSQIWDRAAHG
jgi:hypothetical protein